MGGDAFAAARETEMLGGGGFHRDGFERQSQVVGDVLNHLRDVGKQFGGLRDDGDIDIDRMKVALLAYYPRGLAQQHAGIRALVARIGVREMISDVTQGCGPEQCVRERVERDISVAVAQQPEMMGDFDSAQNELAAFNKAVHVISVSDSEHFEGVF